MRGPDFGLRPFKGTSDLHEAAWVAGYDDRWLRGDHGRSLSVSELVGSVRLHEVVDAC
jgi:hypothetical protein